MIQFNALFMITIILQNKKLIYIIYNISNNQLSVCLIEPGTNNVKLKYVVI